MRLSSTCCMLLMVDIDINVSYYLHCLGGNSVNTKHLHDHLMHLMLLLICINCSCTNCTHVSLMPIMTLFQIQRSHANYHTMFFHKRTHFYKQFVQWWCQTYDNQLSQITKAIKDLTLRMWLQPEPPETQQDREREEFWRAVNCRWA